MWECSFFLPVEYVEEAVETECCNIVRGNVFDEPDFIEHNDLRDKCDGFQPQRETPCELPRSPPAVDNTGHHYCCRNQNLEVREVVT